MAQGIRDGRNFGWDERVRQARLDMDADSEAEQYVKATVKSRTKLWKVMRVIELILVAFIAITVAQPAATPTAPPANMSPSGKQVAYAAVAQWLGEGALGTTGHIISWDGATTGTMKDSSKTVKIARHSFTVQTDLNRWFKVTTTIRLDKGLTIGRPAVTPLALDSTQSLSGADADWKEADGDLENPSAVETLLEQWGEAYAGSDADRLKTVVADQKNPNAVYQPLMLAGTADVSVDKTAYLANRGKKDKNTGHTDMAVARVTITMKVADVASSAGFSYDVLVSQPDGSPRILAWGAPGTGPTLKEYSNRWHGTLIDEDTVTNEAKAAEQATSTTTATGTDTTGTTGSTDSTDGSGTTSDGTGTPSDTASLPTEDDADNDGGAE